MDKKRRIVVTGIGCVSPAGNSVPDTWKAVVEGKSGIGMITHFDPERFTSKIAGEVKNFQPEKVIDRKSLRRMARFVQFAMVSSVEAFEDSGLDSGAYVPERFGVVLGSGIGGIDVVETQHDILNRRGPEKLSPFVIPMIITNMAPGLVSMRFNLKGPNTAVSTACATGTHSIGEAFKTIIRGDADLMLAGGTEASITRLGHGGFCALKALSTRNDDPAGASRPFDGERDGFVMGEGAGVMILEELEHAKKRGAVIHAEITGYGLSADAHHMTAPAPGGEGAIRSMKMALDDASINTVDVDYVNAHGTSTKLNDKFETMAMKSLFKEHVRKFNVSSTKGVTGHLIGAAGGVEAVFCVKAIETGEVPPTINQETPDPDCDLDYVPNTARNADVKVAMSNSFGFGGHNATLVFQKYTG